MVLVYEIAGLGFQAIWYDGFENGYGSRFGGIMQVNGLGHICDMVQAIFDGFGDSRF